MKRTLSLLLALVLALSVCGVSAFAVATPLTGGSSQATAANIPDFDVDYVSSLDTVDEVDWFKFTTLSEDAYYSINSKNYDLSTSDTFVHYLHVVLYDANTNILSDSRGDANQSFSIIRKLEPNTDYYLKVYHDFYSTGHYQIGITYKYDEIPNNQENSSLIHLNKKTVQSLDGPGDVDWYYCVAPLTGNYTLFSKNYNILSDDIFIKELQVFLYDAYMQELAHLSCYQNTSSSKTINLENGQKYYLKVYHQNTNSTGNYELSISTDLPIPAQTLQSIAIITQPTKTTYQVGEAFNQSGMVVRATYSDGSSANVTGFTVSGYNATLPGTQTLTVSYTEGGVTKTATLNVTVMTVAPQRALSYIAIQSYPNKTEYNYGEAFNQTGMVVRAYYTDGTSANVTGFTVSGYNATLPGTQTLTVSYTEGGVTKTATFMVRVLSRRVLTGIVIVSEPTKTTYELGETLDMTGFALNGIYSDGTTARITNYQVSGFDSSTAGQKVVSVSVQDGYTVFTQTFTVTVNAKQTDTADGLQQFLNFLRNVWTPLVKVVKLVLTLFSSLLNAIQ